jgi:hypothetical protein
MAHGARAGLAVRATALGASLALWPAALWPAALWPAALRWRPSDQGIKGRGFGKRPGVSVGGLAERQVVAGRAQLGLDVFAVLGTARLHLEDDFDLIDP